MPFKLPSLRTLGLIGSAISFALLAIALLASRIDAQHWKTQAENQKLRHERDLANVEAASAQAIKSAVLNSHYVAQRRAAIDERTIDALKNDRDRAVAGLGRLRAQTAAHIRDTAQPDLSALREATCRAVANAACDTIPATLKAAQDNTDQLIALIAWAKEQGAVPTTPTDPAPANLETANSDTGR